MMIGLAHFVILSAILAAAGIAVMLTRRNALGILIGVELLLNAGGINFVAFNRLAHVGTAPDGAPLMDGVVFTFFIIVLAAAEAAVALAIFLNYYNTFRSIDVDRASELKG
ncbi:MAG: NADH-quinone oxidoreductase subunit NuoK [Phycisphaeraceae bacterium]|nr:NADH-quinone oxidoreductase subunit NuoK [Phycisphaeraceae bacterium]